MGTHLIYLLHFQFFFTAMNGGYFSVNHWDTRNLHFPNFALLVRNRRKKGSFFPFRIPSGENGFKRREKGGRERRKRKVKFLPPSVFPFLRSSGFEFNRRCGGGSKEKGKGLLSEEKRVEMWQSQFKNIGIKTLNFAIFEKYIYLPILVTAPGNIEIFKSFLQIYLRDLRLLPRPTEKRGKFL